MSVLSDRLKLLREEKGMTQEMVASKLNLTKSAYGYYEQGKTVPDAYMLSNIARIFNVSTDYLLGRIPVKNYTTTSETHKIINSYESLLKDAQEHINSYIEFLVDKYKK